MCGKRNEGGDGVEGLARERGGNAKLLKRRELKAISLISPKYCVMSLPYVMDKIIFLGSSSVFEKCKNS